MNIIKELEEAYGYKAIRFSAKTMNGVTYADCEYIAQSRGYILGSDKESGFTCDLYCFPNSELHCLDALTSDGDFKCHVKTAKKGKAYLIMNEVNEYETNYDYINTLKDASVYMPVKEMRNKLGYTQEMFSDKYGIPKRTIENWESGSRKAPEYVIGLLYRAVKEDYKKLRGKEIYRD